MNTRPLEQSLGATAIADGLIAAWRAAGRILRALRHRHQVHELMHFDDRMLADIGISRHDLHRALDASLLEDPSRGLVDAREQGRRRSTVQRNKAMSE